LETAVGRAALDPVFANQLLNDHSDALSKADLALDPAELDQLQSFVQGSFDLKEMDFQRETLHKQISAQVDRTTELGTYTVQILKDTLRHATQTYKTITSMARALFIVGLALFVASAIVSLVTDKDVSALIMGGLGAASFIVIFITGPIDKSQIALSNLVQVEIIFMDFFEQITFWENYGLQPVGMPPHPSPSHIEKASASLQSRATQTVELLQKFVEPLPQTAN
jgi:hypothetical protein